MTATPPGAHRPRPTIPVSPTWPLVPSTPPIVIDCITGTVIGPAGPLLSRPVPPGLG